MDYIDSPKRAHSYFVDLAFSGRSGGKHRWTASFPARTKTSAFAP